MEQQIYSGDFNFPEFKKLPGTIILHQLLLLVMKHSDYKRI